MGNVAKSQSAPRLTAGVAEHYASRNERIYDLTNGTESGALVSVRADDDTIRVDVYRVTGKVLVALPGRPLALLTEQDSLAGAAPMWTQLTAEGASYHPKDVADFGTAHGYDLSSAKDRKELAAEYVSSRKAPSGLAASTIEWHLESYLKGERVGLYEPDGTTRERTDTRLFQLEIETYNTAFKENPGELGRLLRVLADQVDKGVIAGPVIDGKGLQVGTFWFGDGYATDADADD